jgi:hypothetical protein
MRIVMIALVMIGIIGALPLRAQGLGAAGRIVGIEEKAPATTPKEPEKMESKQLSIDRLGFTITIPQDTWKADLKDDDAAPLELSHPGSALVQLVTFQKTMATIPELIGSLNAAYEKKFTDDGAKEYAIKINKDFKFKSRAGKRVLSTFRKGKDAFLLDQMYVEGNDRIFVLVLTINKAGYDKVKSDFEKMARSMTLAGSEGQSIPPKDQEKKDVRNSGKGDSN